MWRLKQQGPHFAVLGIFVLTALVLAYEGRQWWCACGQPFLVSFDTFSAHNSHHLVDAYSLTHVGKGLLLAGLLAWALPKCDFRWAFVLVLGLEALWELVENSPFVIERYRTHTGAVDYQGDSIANSLGDIVSCGVGFLIARAVGFWPSALLFVVIEVLLLLLIRDNLTLNILLLLVPLDAVKQWQQGA